jgi:hypothetical protein
MLPRFLARGGGLNERIGRCDEVSAVVKPMGLADGAPCREGEWRSGIRPRLAQHGLQH